MNNNAVSPLQMIDWRIGKFSFTNHTVSLPSDVLHHWTINAHIDHLETTGSILHATIFVRFAFFVEHADAKVSFDGIAAAYFVFDKEKTEAEDPESFFDRLLHSSAMTNMLGNLRVFLFQAGTLFHTGTKNIMLPFINLNEFEFNKDYTFTV